MRSLDGSVISFADQGAASRQEPSSIEAFELAIELGATGLHASTHLTADRQVVLAPRATIGKWPRRRSIGDLDRSALPPHLPTLDELYRSVGASVALSLHLSDPSVVDAVLEAAQAAGPEAEARLWLCSPDLELLGSLRRRTSARLVNAVRIHSIDGSPERRVAALAANDIDALKLHHSEWHAGLIALVHRFERCGLGWGTEHEREMAKLVDAGIDGVYSSHIDRLTAVVAQFD